MNEPEKLIVAGVDVGSSAIKVVLLEDREGEAPSVLIGRRERVRRRDPAALAARLYDACLEESGLRQVLVGIHIYRPGNNAGRAAARVVVASPTSDDLLTVTLQSAPLLIAQFADQMAALADGARGTALLIGQ